MPYPAKPVETNRDSADAGRLMSRQSRSQCRALSMYGQRSSCCGSDYGHKGFCDRSGPMHLWDYDEAAQQGPRRVNGQMRE
eukprot:707576-Alexandrium_andersonii.AAC.1